MKMKNLITNLSIKKAALIVGISFIIMFLLALFADAFVLQSLVVPGEVVETTNNIKSDQLLFGLGIASYIVILILDAIIALGLYVILRPVNKNLSKYAAILRLLYTAIMGISLFALVLLLPNLYGYGKLIAYVFFILHIFILGYLVYKSNYIPKSLGIFLMIASFCYIILLYGDIILPKEVFEILLMIAMIPATFAELSLGIWLLLKRGKISDLEKII
jgi:hypothetical protein